MTPAYGRGNVSGASKSHAPARVDLSDVQIPHRNSSMREPYVPQDRTVYRANSVDANRPRVRGV